MHKPQVSAESYSFDRYVDLPRWSSIWHQVATISKLSPGSVLEVGPGNGLFKEVCSQFGFQVTTLDHDDALNPDIVGTLDNIPRSDNSFDVACAFQVLEHVPFDLSVKGFIELARVSKKHIVISLPNCQRVLRFLFHIPLIGEKRMLVPRPFQSKPIAKFDGEHYWELGQRDHEVDKIVRLFEEAGDVKLERQFRIFEKPYHQFFHFLKSSE